ncbi:hypothetical protein C1646_176386 [Rhizophagus diaphanus]|nr:hypothetical protein C1646_176386 [Rhizophagus diaphanus] [Rhizophagus sp. MUCL 43196]
MEQNFNLIYKTSFENDFLKLQGFCTELMSYEPEKIFDSIDFISLSEKSLISIIQHDNFQMDVIQVWEHVLKWGIAQNPGLPSDPSNYSKDEFITLRGTLQQLIPFIKFFNLNHKEFLNKVYPFKKILPKDLRENLIKHFIDQPNSKLESKIITKEINPKSIDSRIITNQHAELISKWIDKLEITDNMKNSYEFKLILRGSRDGFLTNKFHEICDNQSHTISIIKVEDSNEILGGYNPIKWKSDDSFGTTNDSFIFSFENKEIIENYILSRIKSDAYEYAIYNFIGRGPSFYHDLFLYNPNCGVAIPLIYDKPIKESEFFYIEECEIFQIMKD